jgi:hypothetical protein
VTDQPIALDALNEFQGQQLLGWLYSSLKGGRVVDVAEWNHAVTQINPGLGPGQELQGE